MAEQFGIHDTLIVTGVCIALLLPSVVDSLFTKRFDIRDAQRWGFGIFAFCAVLMMVSPTALDGLALYMVFNIVTAVCQGIGFTDSVTELLGRSTKDQRPGMFSLIYLISYGGFAIPNLVVGLIPRSTASTPS